MEAKFTKGIFTIDKAERNSLEEWQCKVYIYVKSEDRRELHCVCYGYTGEEAEANAKLVANSCEMFEALIKAHYAIPIEDVNAYDAVEKVIQKVTE